MTRGGWALGEARSSPSSVSSRPTGMQPPTRRGTKGLPLSSSARPPCLPSASRKCLFNVGIMVGGV
eukprot:713955-Pleurochrysis_carterae.AAC.1